MIGAISLSARTDREAGTTVSAETHRNVDSVASSLVTECLVMSKS